MALRTEILISILLVIVVSCNVEAREGGFFNPSVPVKENAPYLDPKEYYPTGRRENSYNSYSGEGQGNGYGNGAGEGGGYKEGVNGYGKGAEYTTQNGGGAGYAKKLLAMAAVMGRASGTVLTAAAGIERAPNTTLSLAMVIATAQDMVPAMAMATENTFLTTDIIRKTPEQLRLINVYSSNVASQ